MLEMMRLPLIRVRIETKIPPCRGIFVLVGRKNLPANGRKLPPERFGHAKNVSGFSNRQLARALQDWRRQIGKVVAMNINSVLRSYFPPGGTQGVSASSSAGAGDTMKSSSEARANAARGVTTYDFSQMSRSQMQGVAQGLYKSGQIDLTQLFMLQQAGPIGKVGPMPIRASPGTYSRRCGSSRSCSRPGHGDTAHFAQPANWTPTRSVHTIRNTVEATISAVPVTPANQARHRRHDRAVSHLTRRAHSQPPSERTRHTDGTTVYQTTERRDAWSERTEDQRRARRRFAAAARDADGRRGVRTDGLGPGDDPAVSGRRRPASSPPGIVENGRIDRGRGQERRHHDDRRRTSASASRSPTSPTSTRSATRRSS